MKRTKSEEEKKAEALRKKVLGETGEKIAERILAENGFESIDKLPTNYPFADVYAKRDGKCYVISVKMREKYGHKYRDDDSCKKENDSFNLFQNPRGDEKVQKAEEEYSAEAHWLVMPLDDRYRKYSAYFGSVTELRELVGNNGKKGRRSVPIPKCKTREIGECFFENRNFPKEFVKEFIRVGIFR